MCCYCYSAWYRYVYLLFSSSLLCTRNSTCRKAFCKPDTFRSSRPSFCVDTTSKFEIHIYMEWELYHHQSTRYNKSDKLPLSYFFLRCRHARDASSFLFFFFPLLSSQNLQFTNLGTHFISKGNYLLSIPPLYLYISIYINLFCALWISPFNTHVLVYTYCTKNDI